MEWWKGWLHWSGAFPLHRAWAWVGGKGARELGKQRGKCMRKRRKTRKMLTTRYRKRRRVAKDGEGEGAVRRDRDRERERREQRAGSNGEVWPRLSACRASGDGWGRGKQRRRDQIYNLQGEEGENARRGENARLGERVWEGVARGQARDRQGNEEERSDVKVKPNKGNVFHRVLPSCFRTVLRGRWMGTWIGSKGVAFTFLSACWVSGDGWE